MIDIFNVNSYSEHEENNITAIEWLARLNVTEMTYKVKFYIEPPRNRVTRCLFDSFLLFCTVDWRSPYSKAFFCLLYTFFFNVYSPAHLLSRFASLDFATL